MKNNRAYTAIVFILLMGMLAGCRSLKNADTSAATTASISPDATQETLMDTTPYAPGSFSLADDISYRVVNGFLISEDGQIFYRIDDGELVRITVTEDTISIPCEGKEYTQSYTWAEYDGEIGLWLPADTYLDLTAVKGNDLIRIEILNSTYFLLMNVDSGEILDPLGSLPEEMKARINDASFSPDGTRALLQCDKGDSLFLYSEGELTDLSEQCTAGYFLDNNTAILIKINTEDAWKPTVSTAVYSVDSRMVTQIYENIPLYRQDTQERGIRLFGSRYAVRIAGTIQVLDLLTGDERDTGITAKDGMDIFCFDEEHFLIRVKEENIHRYTLLDAKA